jgi:23S rRNA maturation-related 3'-5' exoribonuclease YhaM
MNNKVKRIKNAVVVCSHTGMVEFLKSEGYIDDSAVVLSRAKIDDIRGKVVFGSIPLFLAFHAAEVIHIPLKLPANLRDKELSAAEFRKYALKPASYHVERKIIG